MDLDFNDTSVQLTFTPPNLTMEDTVQCVNISVLDDVEIEVVEYFRVLLSTSGSGVILNIRTARVAIRDTVSLLYWIKKGFNLNSNIVISHPTVCCD